MSVHTLNSPTGGSDDLTLILDEPSGVLYAGISGGLGTKQAWKGVAAEELDQHIPWLRDHLESHVGTAGAKALSAVDQAAARFTDPVQALEARRAEFHRQWADAKYIGDLVNAAWIAQAIARTTGRTQVTPVSAQRPYSRPVFDRTRPVPVSARTLYAMDLYQAVVSPDAMTETVNKVVAWQENGVNGVSVWNASMPAAPTVFSPLPSMAQAKRDAKAMVESMVAGTTPLVFQTLVFDASTMDQL